MNPPPVGNGVGVGLNPLPMGASPNAPLVAGISPLPIGAACTHPALVGAGLNPLPVGAGLNALPAAGISPLPMGVVGMTLPPVGAGIPVGAGVAGINPPPVDVRNLRFGAPGSDDTRRSPDEVRIIKEMASEDVEMFLQANHIDTAATARELRNEPLHVAYMVMERGPLRACINPSGALVARIRDAKRGVLAGGPSRFPPPPQNLDPNASELDRFLCENRIDQAAIASLRAEPADVQKAIMAKGPLIHSTNPSASLMARIRNCKMDLQQQNLAMGVSLAALPGLGAAPPPPAPRPVSDGALTIEGSINEEALKAIQKLSAVSSPPVAMQPSPQSFADRLVVPSSEYTGPKLRNSGDQRLQDEALKAIQELNYSEL